MAKMSIAERVKVSNIGKKIKIYLNKGRRNVNTTIYLAYYKNYKKFQEYLDINLTGEAVHDENSFRLACIIRDKREAELTEEYIPLKKEIKSSIDLRSFVETMIEHLANKTKLYYRNLINQFLLFMKLDNIDIKKISETNVEKWLSKYQDHSKFTENAYCRGMKSILSHAVRKGYISKNPLINIKINKPEAEKTFLTIDEIRLVNAAECNNLEVKKAFLFSCLTGLRLSDIIALDWKQIQDNEYLLIRQVKTKNYVSMMLPDSAKVILEEQLTLHGSAGNIFNLPTYKHTRKHLEVLINNAGITKHITFHSARHTFATMCLSLGIDIYTVSKLLGHRELSTTQGYAKLIDAVRDGAMKKIPKI